MCRFFKSVAGAPISWVICEVPSWGLELSVERLLSEMQELGLAVTELGSNDYLLTDPCEVRKVCALRP